MDYQSVESCFSGEQSSVNLRGWVHRLRKQKRYTFLQLRDSTGVIQCIMPRVPEHDNITIESSIELSGTLHEDPRSPGGYEVRVDNYNLVGQAEDYPIRRDFSTEHLNNNRHLWNRSRKMQNIAKIRHTLLRASRT